MDNSLSYMMTYTSECVGYQKATIENGRSESEFLCNELDGNWKFGRKVRIYLSRIPSRKEIDRARVECRLGETYKESTCYDATEIMCCLLS